MTAPPRIAVVDYGAGNLRSVAKALLRSGFDVQVTGDAEALRQALGDAEGIRRYGSQVLPMAEAKVEVSVDVSNRPYLVYRVDLPNARIGSFDASLTEDFLYALAHNAGLDLHVDLRYGKSPHHVVEAIFKGLARALRVAVERDPRVKGLPTVKGAL
jgi:imidazoleglycerol-phosphate dehydratase